ncbi:MAG: hypothetical protein HZA12_07530 [Nitrospirae bacterium]|nr:hypothetical protein [Nitrospirota bacterium]
MRNEIVILSVLTRNRHMLMGFTLVILLPLLLISQGCFGSNFTRLTSGSQITMSGEIENIIRTELPYKKEMLSITSVGFPSGQGISLIGLHPGLTKGKKVQIQAEFFENIRGTDVFKVIQVVPEPTPEPTATK